MKDLPSRVLIHAGFHKTATTSAQRFLRVNRKVIRRHAAFALKWRFADVTQAALSYSMTGEREMSDKFRFRFLGMLGEMPPKPGKPLILSSEELIGHMPGHRDVTTYAAAFDLCEDMADAIAQIYGADTPLTFLFTTRAPDAWYRSAWAHLVTQSGYTHGLDQFRAEHPDAADFDAIADQLRARLPTTLIETVALDSLQRRPMGPGAVFLPTLALSERALSKLQKVPPQNVTPAEEVVQRALARNQMKSAT